MIRIKSESDLQSLFNLAERKAELAGGYLTITRTPLEWKVAPCKPGDLTDVVGYESLFDALSHFIIGDTI
jgi:hypothetical protein